VVECLAGTAEKLVQYCVRFSISRLEIQACVSLRYTWVIASTERQQSKGSEELEELEVEGPHFRDTSFPLTTIISKLLGSTHAYKPWPRLRTPTTTKTCKILRRIYRPMGARRRALDPRAGSLHPIHPPTPPHHHPALSRGRALDTKTPLPLNECIASTSSSY
jgi:hypothetical protein